MTSRAFGAVFIVPEDRELVDKSAGIVVGVVAGSESRPRGNGDIETVYDVTIERVLKGTFARGSTISVASPGGSIDKRFTLVPGSAHFAKDDRVLLFLVPHDGAWTMTDMALGKFRFVISTDGQSLLLRDEENIIGFDRQMRTHVEKIRREAEFLAFIEETVRGRDADANYFVTPGEYERDPVSPTALTPQSYAVHFPGLIPGRWPETRMSATTPRPFFKNADQSATGLADGGVQMITNALNAWTNDCGSAVNIPYGGTNALLNDETDHVNTILWNDPSEDIPGPWTGAGIIATAFLRGDEELHTFNGMVDGWRSFSDTDLVIQDGLTGAEWFIATTVTHEIGHALALRHSNMHHDDTPCRAGDECTVEAIMNSSINVPWNYTLQPWDQNAIRALYPASCEPPPATPIDVAAFSTSGSSVTVQWAASASATSYKVFRRSSVSASYTEIASGVTGSPYVDNTVVSGTGYQYVVRASNAAGDSANSDADFTAAISFTDHPLVAGSTTVTLAHFTEVITAVNALRALGGLGAMTFTQGAPAAGATIKASHIDDLRDALNEAYTSVGAGGLVFDDDPVPVGSPILMWQMHTLRALVK